MKRLLLAFLLCSLEAAASTPRPADEGVRFRTLDVVLTSDAPIAAWQVEITTDGGDSRIVGVEGGAEAPFDAPPRHDPAALQSGRIILAAFDTGRALPAGKHRVATLHLREAGAAPRYQIELVAAGDPAGERVSATVTVDPRSPTP